MNIPDDHKKLLSQKDFRHGCSREIFSEGEFEIFDDFGNWLSGLARGEIKSFTPEQRLFVLAAHGKAEPETPFERLWVKYQRRVAWERENKDIPQYEWQDPGEIWFSRKDIERMSPNY
jgi:uncharacterized protein YifE (UPF0438 family)